MWNPPGDVNLKSKMQLRPLFFKTSPEVGQSLWKPHSVLACFIFASSPVLADLHHTRPFPSARTCGKSRFASGSKRTRLDIPLRGLPPPPRAALFVPPRPGMKATQATTARWPQPGAARPSAPAREVGGAGGPDWGGHPSLGSSLHETHKSSVRFRDWCFYVPANVPLPVNPCPLCHSFVSQEHHRQPRLISPGILLRPPGRVGLAVRWPGSKFQPCFSLVRRHGIRPGPSVRLSFLTCRWNTSP